MAEWLFVSLVVYAAGVAMTMIVAMLVMVSDVRWRVRRAAARTFFLAWVWPAVLVRLGASKLAETWDTAEWGTR